MGTMRGHRGQEGDTRAISGPPQICLKATLETSRGHQGLLEDVLGPPGPLWGHQGHLGATRATWGLPGPPGNHPRDTLGTRGPPQGHHGHRGYTSRPPQGLLEDVLGPLWGHGGHFGAGQLVELAFKMPPRDVPTHGDTVNANPRWEAASPAIFLPLDMEEHRSVLAWRTSKTPRGGRSHSHVN